MVTLTNHHDGKVVEGMVPYGSQSVRCIAEHQWPRNAETVHRHSAASPRSAGDSLEVEVDFPSGKSPKDTYKSITHLSLDWFKGKFTGNLYI